MTLLEGCLTFLKAKRSIANSSKPKRFCKRKAGIAVFLHKVTLGEIVDLLQEFKQQPVSLMIPKRMAVNDTKIEKMSKIVSLTSI